MKARDMSDVLAMEEMRQRVYSEDEIACIREELEGYLEEADGHGLIKHPLITYMGYDPDSRETVTMLGRWLAQKRHGIEQLASEGDWSQVLMLHEKPWRMHALIEYAPPMDDEDYWDELGDIWCQIKNPGEYLVALPDLFHPGNRGTEKRFLMMNEEEQAALQTLPEKLTIYRGCAEGNRVGFSWSIDREKAEWFAHRCGFAEYNASDTLLLVGECRKADVVAHFTRREEEEIVIDPEDVAIIDTIGRNSRSARSQATVST